MADKLGVYNAVLGLLGERKLASLSEGREPRRVLDDFWAGGVGFCLEQGQWNFAMRAMEIASSPDASPTFGFQYAFAKPEDWIRTAGLSADPTLDPPLNDYYDEQGYWWANVDPLYVRIISSDPEYGWDLSLWPRTFERYVVAHLAAETCDRITSSSAKYAEMRRLEKERRTDAMSKDAMNDPPGFAPVGSWVRSRNAGWSRRRENG